MQLAQDHIDYIYNHYSGFMTEREYKAWKHYSTTYKFEGVELPEMLYKKEWVTKDEDILRLLDGGFENFKRNIAKRIYAEHWIDIFLNYCPKCNKLARTPAAKQCRYCLHDWHDEIV